MIETGLMLSMVAHLTAGYIRAYRRLPTLPFNSNDAWYTRWHRTAGHILAWLVPVHMTLTRGMTLLGKQMPADFDYVRSVMVGMATPFVAPYYTLLLLAGTYHAMQGLMISLSRVGAISNVTYHRYADSKSWIALIGVVAALGLGGLAGFRYNIGIPENLAYWNQKLPTFLQNTRGTSSSFW